MGDIEAELVNGVNALAFQRLRKTRDNSAQLFLGTLSRRCRRRVVAFFCKRPLERRADLALKSAETSAARAVLIKAAQPSGRHACRASAQAVLASLDGLCAELSRVLRRR